MSTREQLPKQFGSNRLGNAPESISKLSRTQFHPIVLPEERGKHRWLNFWSKAPALAASYHHPRPSFATMAAATAILCTPEHPLDVSGVLS
ncbi:hypothetical protein PHLGIDRAFT_123531 [Phlebiopsis gigantea 11061_1 CR5-6]|uniref:Uncharacterized protein n=1 Tax=Phlebiopsis gigantea (strain 11061_1 CR5-6) TaxID=745531 RepID=A0A0C3RYH5_PHLG1|nr:hypothetical protein PHLGIDRAFT_123531 [Phlebiopsis gigantea 11061_1 CR5-6]